MVLFVFGLPLWAQPLNCGPYYGRTLSNFPTVRPTGVTEMIGEIAVLCTGGSGVTHDVTVTLSLSVPITSANPTGAKTDAILFVNEPQRSAMVAGENAFASDFDPPAAGSTSTYSLRFSGVKLSESSEGRPLILRIVNVRANAAVLYPRSSVNTAINATIDTSPRLPGFPMTGVVAEVGSNGPLVTTSISQKPGYQMEVTVREANSRDFRCQAYNEIQQIPLGLLSEVESGIVTTILTPLGIPLTGLADSGTRIMLRFSNVSPGQQVFVSTASIATGMTATPVRLTSSDEGGAGPFAAIAPTSVTPAPGIAPVAITNGRGTAVYEVLGGDFTHLELATFGIVLQGGSGTPAVDAVLGPLTTSPKAWIPRFVPPRTAAAVVPTGVFRDSLKRVRVLEYGNPELYNGGGVFEGKPGAAQDSEGNTYIVARDSWRGLWATRFNVASKTFDQWTSLGGQTLSDPSVAVSEDGTTYYVIRDDWNNCWLGKFPHGAPNEWQYLGGVFSSDPQVAWSRPGYLLIAGRDAWGGVWTRSMSTTPDASGYETQWRFRGGIVQEQISLSPQVGVTLLAARDAGNGLWFGYISPPSTFTWLSGQGVIDRGPQMAGRSAVGSIANSVWTKQLDTSLVNPLQWIATGGVLASEAPAWLNNELYVVGRDSGNNIWWYRSVTGQWTKTGHTGIALSDITAVPR